MPETKDSLLRLIEIDKMLHNHLEGVSVGQMSERFGVSRRTIENDLNFIKEEKPLGLGANVVSVKSGRNVFYRYEDPHFSIFSPPINEDEKNILANLFDVLSRFEGIEGREWLESLKVKVDGKGFADCRSIIEYENDDYLARGNVLKDFYNYILNKTSVEMEYHPFGKPVKKVKISPYYLKQFNRRWFLVAKTEGYKTLSVYGVDRIVKRKACTTYKYEETDVDFKEYFDDVVGVTIKKNNSKPQNVILAVDKLLVRYGDYGDSVLPPIIQDIMKNILYFGNKNGAHVSTKSDKRDEEIDKYLKAINSHNVLFAYALQLCDLFLWWGKYIEEEKYKEAKPMKDLLPCKVEYDKDLSTNYVNLDGKSIIVDKKYKDKSVYILSLTENKIKETKVKYKYYCARCEEVIKTKTN